MTEQEQKKELMQKLVNSLHNELYNNRTGYIYCITNKINNKKYIGLTTNTIEIRWKGHVIEHSKSGKQYDKVLYAAMRKYKIENFEIREIEKCTISKLAEREIYWIAYYDTYKNKENGYNLTPGGEIPLEKEYNEYEIIELYKKCGTIKETSELLEIRNSVVSKILIKNGIKPKTSLEISKENAYTIKIYKNGKLLHIAESATDAGQWFLNNNSDILRSKNPVNIGRGIYHASQVNIPYYGYDIISDSPKLERKIKNKNKIIEIYKNDELLRTLNTTSEFIKFLKIFTNDPEQTIKRKVYNALKSTYECYGFKIKSDFYQDKYKKEIEKYKNNNHTINKKQYVKHKTHNICPTCGKKLMKNAKKCKKCIEKEYDETIPERNILKQLIRTKSFSEISKEYNVSEKTIKTWCKKRNLPTHRRTIDSINDKDWEDDIFDLSNDEIIKKNEHEINIEELKEKVYKMSKKDLVEYFGFCDVKSLNKFLKKHNILSNYKIIIKFSPKEWKQEKWNDESFMSYINKERIKYGYPERTKLKELIRNYNFIEIGEMYNLNESVIRKLLKQFKLPYHRAEIDEYSDEEWNEL